MIAAPGFTSLVARWAHYYGDTKVVSAGVTYVHLAGILLGGGTAVAADRESLRLRPDGGAEMSWGLARLRSVHRLVVMGLAIIVTSGLMILFSDLDTYLGSALYWTKMALVAALLLNGFVRLRAEGVLERGGDAWKTFRVTSVLSLVLWFGILLAGAYLTTIA
ncbi:MAG: hypothetical protein ABJD11_14755 [Gemmatimonadota bacterium]